MTKSKPTYELTSVSFRFAPEQVRQLTLLATVYGGQTRALAVALDRLYQQTLVDNPVFAELVADDYEPEGDQLSSDAEGKE